jgi:hypothetical protein
MALLPKQYQVITALVDRSLGERGVIYRAAGFDFVGIMTRGGRAAITLPDGTRISERTARRLVGTGGARALARMGFDAVSVPRSGARAASKGNARVDQCLGRAISEMRRACVRTRVSLGEARLGGSLAAQDRLSRIAGPIGVDPNLRQLGERQESVQCTGRRRAQFCGRHPWSATKQLSKAGLVDHRLSPTGSRPTSTPWALHVTTPRATGRDPLSQKLHIPEARPTAENEERFTGSFQPQASSPRSFQRQLSEWRPDQRRRESGSPSSFPSACTDTRGRAPNDKQRRGKDAEGYHRCRRLKRSSRRSSPGRRREPTFRQPQERPQGVRQMACAKVCGCQLRAQVRIPSAPPPLRLNKFGDVRFRLESLGDITAQCS